MSCPNCSAAAPEGAEDCAACGVIFSKWKAKAEKAAQEPPPAPAEPPAASAGTLGSTTALLAFLCAGVFIAYGVFKRRVEPPPEEAMGVTVNPESFKTELRVLEAALYREAPPTAADAETVSAQAARIAGRLYEKYSHNPLVKDAAAEMLAFSGHVSGSAEALAALPAARLDWARRWEALRARRFGKAPWLHAATTASEGGPPDFERAAQSILAKGRQLKSLVDSLPAELAPFGEERAEKQLEAWRSWVPAWRARVDSTLADFPGPQEIPESLEPSYQSLVRSAQRARSPPSPGDKLLPAKDSRDAWASDLTAGLSELPKAVNAARQAGAGAPASVQQ